MGDIQRVDLGQAQRAARPTLLPQVMTLLMLAMVVAGAVVLYTQQVLPVAAGRSLLDWDTPLVAALKFGAVALLVCLAWTVVWLVHLAHSRAAAPTRPRLLALQSVALMCGYVVALAPIPLVRASVERAQQTACTMVDQRMASVAALSARHMPPPMSVDTAAMEAAIGRALPLAPNLHVVYQPRRELAAFPGRLEVQVGADQRIQSVRRGLDDDRDATARWRGRPLADIERQLGPARSREREFEPAWRVLVIYRDRALVREAGQDSLGPLGAWVVHDVCKSGLLFWDEDPERFRNLP